MLRQTLSASIKRTKIGIIGAPFNLGQTKVGVEDGPKELRKTGFIEELRKFGYDVADLGDVTLADEVEKLRLDIGPDGEKNHSRVLDYNSNLADVVSNAIKDDRLPVTLGGDHSIAIGTIAGHYQAMPQKQMSVLWVDAHSDINTGATSPSGNMHGMPVAYLLRQMKNHVNLAPERDWPTPCLSSGDIVYVGLRDIDAGEQEKLDELKILSYGMKDIDSIGITEVLARCFDHLNLSANKTLHLSFDIDSLDPKDAPSTGTSVPGGLTLREGLLIGEAARETGYLHGLDLVEVNPGIGTAKDAQQTSQSARSIILATIAGYRGA